MTDFLTHESLFRTKEVMALRAESKILVLGLGALGSNLIPVLVRNGFMNITGIDNDRVDRHNPANQYYTNLDVGRKKTAILKNKIHRELGIKIEVIDIDVQKTSATFFQDFDLIIDAFDNWDARKYTHDVCEALEMQDKLVHAGMSDQGYFEVRWDKNYQIPLEEVEQEDVCDYPLACNLVYFTVSFLSEIICKFIDNDERKNISFTLNDLSISVN